MQPYGNTVGNKRTQPETAVPQECVSRVERAGQRKVAAFSIDEEMMAAGEKKTAPQRRYG
jgi:hypothetical protein